jgi:hypothetical protein
MTRDELHAIKRSLCAEYRALMVRRYPFPPARRHWTRRDACRLDKLTRQLTEIEKALKRSR